MQSSLSPTLDGAPVIPARLETTERASTSGVVVLVGMCLLAAIVYAVLASRVVMPLVTPDEFTYGHLASSIANGDGFTWRGDPVTIRSALYIFLITPSWLVASGTDAYLIAKITGAILLSTVAIPVWLIARELADRRVAVLCAGLTLTGLWMTTAGFLLTENLAIPLGVATLAALVMMLRRPESRWGWITLCLAAVATGARTQLVALFAVVAVALGLEIMRAGGNRREVVAAHRRHLIALGAAVVVGLLAVAVAHDSVLGRYSGVTSQRPGFGHALSVIGRTALSLVPMSGFVPAAAFVAMLGSRRAWRDEVVGPLLAVVSAAALVLVVESGWFTAGQPLTWQIERYVVYVVPLMLVLALIGIRRERLPRTRFGLCVLGVAALWLLMPPIRSALEERSYFISSLRVHQLLGTGDRLSLAVGCLLVGAAAFVILSRTKKRSQVLAVGALLALVFAVQTEGSWNWQIHITHEVRNGFPSDLAWMQHDVNGDVAELLTDFNTPESAMASFFSPHVTRLYSSPKGVTGIAVIGGSCPWSVNDQGGAFFDPRCGPTPRRLYLDTPGIRMTFRGEKVLADRGQLARVVEVPAGQPQLSGYVTYSCGRTGPVLALDLGSVRQVTNANCSGRLSGFVFPKTSARLEITYHGGTSSHYVAVNGDAQLVPAGRDATVTIPVKPGPQRFDISEDWTSTAGAPTIVRGELVEQDITQRVL